MASLPFQAKLRNMAFTIWHTPDLHVLQQGRFWETVNIHIQFTPSNEFGLLCITPYPGCPGHSKPLQGYVIGRPRALELSIPSDVEVTCMELSQERMQEWWNNTAPWTSIK